MERKYKIGDITDQGTVVDFNDCLIPEPCYMIRGSDKQDKHRYESELTLVSRRFPPEYLAPATTEDEVLGDSNSTPEEIEKLINPEKFGGTKNDTGKPPLDLLDRDWMNEVAHVLEYGRKTYGKNNWRKGFVYSRLIAAALRHITAFNSGEDQDPETGLLHLAHASTCLMFLTSYMKTNRKELDDR